MAKVQLDLTRLLGFKIIAKGGKGVDNAKIGSKIGGKPDITQDFSALTAAKIGIKTT